MLTAQITQPGRTTQAARITAGQICTNLETWGNTGRSASNPRYCVSSCLVSFSCRILIVIGAGLSRPSGLPTFRQDASFWVRPMEEIATRSGFNRNRLEVWDAYDRMRMLVVRARPNAGHIALAKLAAAKPEALTITQNIDELSQRAGHPVDRSVQLHGSVLEAKCSAACPGTIRIEQPDPLLDMANKDLPMCLACSSVTRPGVVWFGERLPSDALARIETWLYSGRNIELVLVIGTQRTSFVNETLGQGASLAWFNIVDGMMDDLGDANWFVNGDASQTLPYFIDLTLSEH
ncbi:DHS-like NAD/FAD-binding domain-containing protein [Teratosphaeria nubilosa]|uniref:DHS-like NAD/FAD-binding domain-containing protein n=1 Tax=Teratosphaeria nubilosa TaxID=161662 RepID=A0A6G1KXP1_9PEZI|nr:DHS-like NAD/FAD-binding domain-containing protein [Teratosphaeria nubilosa]